MNRCGSPYYSGIEKDYTERYRRDFHEDMKNAEKYFCRNTMSLIGDRFNKCFVEKVSDWCHARGVLFTGHLMNDDMPYGATFASGNFLKNLKTFSVPGIDEITTDFSTEHLLVLLGGAEYACGENGAMAELFALGPCNLSYTAKRCMIFLAACFKIDHYFLAVSHLDMRGNKKIRDYFNDISTTQPDFCGTKMLSEDAKIAAQLAKKDFIPDVYVRYPRDICRAF